MVKGERERREAEGRAEDGGMKADLRCFRLTTRVIRVYLKPRTIRDCEL